jgi:hypothetical protein
VSLREYEPSCPFESSSKIDVWPVIAFAISCPVRFAALTGAGAVVGLTGADKSQWHFPVRQQSIPCEEGWVQELDRTWQEFAGAELPMSEMLSSRARNLNITCIDWQ